MNRAVLVFALAMAGTLKAQQFVPPEERSSASSGIRVGLFGFGSRLGVDFEGTNEVIVSVTLDAADVFTPQVRLRPSLEIGIGDSLGSYVGSLELMYRFTPDSEIAVPYVGFGLGMWFQQRCSGNPDCPDLWAQFALGFELRMRDQINWLLEYHGENGLRRHRFLIGLTTRRGG
ncbi:MAG: hypothetical protein KatS3mg081_2058 [Gemmatimonadales bacterium]|nr:MAG: hypothetical protein KatS3mg081_2058 [Gemmatimonadales bacterium]